MKKIVIFVVLSFLWNHMALASSWGKKITEWTDFVVEDIKDIRCMHRYDVYVPFTHGIIG